MVTGVGNSVAQNSVAPSGSVTGGLAQNFETFLTLLTTQLRNQNPLDPLDTNQFTQELVQFAGVEQQMKQNAQLEALVRAANASAAAAAVSYIGTDVTASGAAAELRDGSAKWHFKAEQSGQAAITIRDAKGNVVFAGTQPIEQGEGVFTWNGRAGDGSQAKPGTYQVTIDARDAAGQIVKVTTEVAGRVTGVDVAEGEPILLVGTRRVPVASISSVRGRNG